MRATRFRAELIEGHKGVTVVIVPFDPEEKWSRKPVRLDARRDGWLVEGTVNGVRFGGYVGNRWGRFFLIVEHALRLSAKASVGDTLEVAIGPTASLDVLALAREQSKVTTAPKKGRPDAIDLEATRATNVLTPRARPRSGPTARRATRARRPR